MSTTAYSAVVAVIAFLAFVWSLLVVAGRASARKDEVSKQNATTRQSGRYRGRRSQGGIK